MQDFNNNIPSHVTPVNLLQCPHCNRNFNEKAGARHIPKCEKSTNRPKPPPSVLEITEK